MSQGSESASSASLAAPESGSSDRGFAFPPVKLPKPHRETVVYNGGEALAGSADNFDVSSEIWSRLFPTQGGEYAPTVSPEGAEVGHFRIEERIGVGGMGAVFRAVDTRLQRFVALKILSPSHSRDDSSVKRFLNEARSAARLDHENIARVHYIGEDRGLNFIAFEYVQGVNLRDLIARARKLDPAEAVNYTIQVALALKHTAAAGVVHRDIKPSNIIATAQGRVKLVDLGLARKDQADSIGDLTVDGTTLGTFDYISPEQAKDPRNVDIRSDIYSLGCSMYHMLTGEPPYPDGTVMQKLLDHQAVGMPDTAAKNRRVTPELSAVVRKMMASEPSQRYQTADQLLVELLPIAAKLGLRGMQPDGLVWTNQKPQRSSFWERHAGWMATIGVLLSVVLVIDYLPRPAVSTQPDYRPDGPILKKSAPRPGEAGAKSLDVSSITEGKAGPSMESMKIPKDGPIPGIKLLVQSDADPSTDSAVGTGTVEPDVETPTNTTPGPDPTPLTSDPPVTTEAPPRPFWVLGSDGQGDVSYASLAGACAAARDGGVIEIRGEDDRPIVAKKSIPIDGKKLTIRAADSRRPLVTFTHNETAGESGSLFALSDASLDLINVNLLLAAGSSTDNENPLSGITLRGRGKVGVRGTTITVENASNRPAAMIRVTATESGTLPKMPVMMNTGNAAKPVYEIEIAESLLRGGADAVRLETITSGRLDVQQTAIAVNGAFLFSRGSLELLKENAQLELRLSHNTCWVGQGLIHLDSGDVPRDLLPVNVTVAGNNLFASNTTNPLVTMLGTTDADTFYRLLTWNGERNFYDGFDLFWSTASVDFLPMDYDSWRAEWERNTTTKEVDSQNRGFAWKGGWNVDFEDVTPKDFALDTEVSPNPAIGGAKDGEDVGVDLSKVPTPPSFKLSRPVE